MAGFSFHIVIQRRKYYYWF